MTIEAQAVRLDDVRAGLLEGSTKQSNAMLLLLEVVTRQAAQIIDLQGTVVELGNTVSKLTGAVQGEEGELTDAQRRAIKAMIDGAASDDLDERVMDVIRAHPSTLADIVGEQVAMSGEDIVGLLRDVDDDLRDLVFETFNIEDHIGDVDSSTWERLLEDPIDSAVSNKLDSLDDSQKADIVREGLRYIL